MSSEKYSPLKIEDINNRLKERNLVRKISFHSITYQDLVDQLKELARTYQFESYLQRLNELFESYCLNMGLMPQSNHVLRAMACGQSFDLNVKYQFYFDLANRGYSKFNYLGIYKWKSVRYIGKVQNVIVANWDEEKGLKIISFRIEPAEEQKERLVSAIKESIDNDWYIQKDHRFFLLEDFVETDFKKTSPGGIFRVRYFNLEDHCKTVPNGMKELAELLKKET